MELFSPAWTGHAGMAPVGLQPIADLAEPAVVLASSTPLLEVEARFRVDERLRAVVSRGEDRWHLLSRVHLSETLAGNYGYGRALLARKTLRDLMPLDTVVVAASASLSQAAEDALQRRPLPTDLVVEGEDALGTVPVTAVFASLADAYRNAAHTDPLTGLPNRLALQVLSARVRTGADGWAMLYVDLDRFKAVNDTLGHEAGDAVLVAFADRLRSCVRPQDVVVRLGGDEFVLLLSEVDELTACAVAERIVLTASAPFVVDDQLVGLGASVGLALLGEGPEDHRLLVPADVLLRHADAAMYRAKSSGRNQWARLDVSGADVGPPLGRRLRSALGSEAFSLHYQPKTRLRDGRVVEVEALCRWTDPELGPVSPATFIPVAEKTGMIVPLGEWVLDTACRQARTWLDDGHPVPVAVNVSAVQLARPEVVADVMAALGRHRLPPELLRLEITETAALSDPATTAARLQRLADAGVLLSLDDFGTGWSSLSLLRTLPVHGVKIDKSFVDRVDFDDADEAMVAMVIQLAHRLGLTVTAEGVERQDQVDVLRALGCDAVQGFLLGRPVPAADVVLPPP